VDDERDRVLPAGLPVPRLHRIAEDFRATGARETELLGFAVLSIGKSAVGEIFWFIAPNGQNRSCPVRSGKLRGSVVVLGEPDEGIIRLRFSSRTGTTTDVRTLSDRFLRRQ
jgi:hypothetical protein